MRTNNLRLRACVCSVLAAAAVNSSAFAEEKVTTLEEIVVTAQHRVESLQDVPLAITAFGDVKRDLIGIQSVQDMANFAPGVSYDTNLDRPSIRGIARQSNIFSLDSPVANYIDGIYTATVQDAARRPIFIERTEILRGPQGALSGRGSIAGAFNTISKQPKDEFGAEARVYGGTYQTYGAEGTVTGPITDWFRARLNVGRYRQNEGYFKNVATGDHEGNHSNNRNIQDLFLDFNFGQSVELSLKGSYVTYDETLKSGYSTAPYIATRVVAPTPYADPGTSFTPVATWAFFSPAPFTEVGTATQNPVLTTGDVRKYSNDTKNTTTLNTPYHSLTSHLTWHAPGVDVKLISGQQKYGYTQVTDLDGTSVLTMRLPPPGTGAFPTGRVVSPGGTNTYKEQREWYSNELTFTSTGTGPVSWIGGVYQSHERYIQPLASYVFTGFPELNQPFGTVPQFLNVLLAGGAPPTVAPAPNQVPGRTVFEEIDGVTDSQAAFGQLDFNLNDQWKFTAGLRYNKDKKSATEYNRFISNVVAEGLGPFLAGGGLGIPLSLDITAVPVPGAPLPQGVVRDRGIDPVTGNRVRDLGDSWHSTTGSAGIDFKPTAQDLLYLRVATGYRPGGFNGGGINPVPEVGKEKLLSYEVGYKTTVFNRLQLGTSVFYYDYKDIQLPLTVYNNCTTPGVPSSCIVNSTFINLPSATSKGVEVEANWNAIGDLNFVLSYGYLDARIKDGISGTAGFTNTEDPAAVLRGARPFAPTGALDTGFTGLPVFTQDLSGNLLANSPKHRVAFNTNYMFRFSPGNLTLSGSYVWRASQFSSVFETKESEVPSYHTVGARLIWTDVDNRYTVILYGSNLTDALAADAAGTTRVSTAAAGAAPSAANVAYYHTYDLEPPREYGLELQYRFGKK